MLSGLRSFFSVGDTSKRIFGLDVMRCVAIVMVVLGHGCMIMPKSIRPVMHVFILDGVAIFFVLSGFLIGGILLRQLQKGRDAWGDLLHFWSRRWMRTLPAYLFVLLILLGYIAYVAPQKFPEHWYKYFFFLQNFLTDRPTFFAESWSLSVEEWFYLSAPLLIFLGIRLFKMPVKTVIPTVIFLFVIGGLIFRYCAYEAVKLSVDPSATKQFFRAVNTQISYDVAARLDAIMYGVLGAYIVHYFPHIWHHKRKWRTFWIGLTILFLTKVRADYVEHFDVVWLFSIRSFSILMMLPALSDWQVEPGKWVRRITFVSLISYSMYLINLQLVFYAIMKNTFYGNVLGKWEVHSWWILDYLLFWVLTVLLSFLMYKWIEQPFMRLRKAD